MADSSFSSFAFLFSSSSSCLADRYRKALGSMRTILCVPSLMSEYFTASLYGPARRPLLLESHGAKLLVAESHSHPFWPCIRYSSPFCLWT